MDADYSKLKVPQYGQQYGKHDYAMLYCAGVFSQLC